MVVMATGKVAASKHFTVDTSRIDRCCIEDRTGWFRRTDRSPAETKCEFPGDSDRFSAKLDSAATSVVRSGVVARPSEIEDGSTVVIRIPLEKVEDFVTSGAAPTNSGTDLDWVGDEQTLNILGSIGEPGSSVVVIATPRGRSGSGVPVYAVYGGLLGTVWIDPAGEVNMLCSNPSDPFRPRTADGGGLPLESFRTIVGNSRPLPRSGKSSPAKAKELEPTR